MTSKSVLIIVAHPDDETLWAGGTILSNPTWRCFIMCLCRGNDADRAPKFYKALTVLKAEGTMGNLDDEPEQKPLDDILVQQTILNLLPNTPFDLIITHNPNGEYTRHLRHEEVSKAVIELWHTEKISARALWTFAYQDGNKAYLPKPIDNAPIHTVLTGQIWLLKYMLMTETYGFKTDSWEAKTTPKQEAFWQFQNWDNAKQWLANGGVVGKFISRELVTPLSINLACKHVAID